MEKILTFYLANNLYGIDIALVKEINRNIECTAVPTAKRNIIGLFNMRGQIVTLFDLASLMGLESHDISQSCACVILKSLKNDPNQIGFLIDYSRDVLNLDRADCEEPPANINNSDKEEFIHFIVKLNDELITVIDPFKIISV